MLPQLNGRALRRRVRVTDHPRWKMGRNVLGVLAKAASWKVLKISILKLNSVTRFG